MADDLFQGFESVTRPLLVDRVSSSTVDPLSTNDRVRVTDTRAGSWIALLGRWRKHPPDAAIAAPGDTAPRIAGALSGVPVVETQSDGNGGAWIRRAAVAAARPGAGLRGNASLSVIVPVLNDAEALEALLDTLVLQLGDNDEVIVVDGGSTDGTPERAARYTDSGVRVLHRPGTNIPAARNAGVKEARCDVIALTDAGCKPAPGWLEALRAAFAEEPAPDLVTGVYRVAAEEPWEQAMAAACYPAVEEAGRAGILTRSFTRVFGRGFDATMPTGRSAAVRVDAWRAVDGMSEDLETAEDVTFGRSLANAGYECVLCKDAEVMWDQRPDLRSTARMYYRYGVGGGLSGDRLVVGRDLTRALAYAVVPYLFFSRGAAAKSAIVGLSMAYLSVPMMRASRRPNPVLVGLLTIPSIVLKDLSKAVGCIAGLTRRTRRR